jgi:hypothetical protein
MSSGNPTDLAMREANLIAAIENMLPDFARACHATDTSVVILHQDAFAADYQEEEYRLVGMAIKFAGICGKEIRVIGTNRQTVTQMGVGSCRFGRFRGTATLYDQPSDRIRER